MFVLLFFYLMFALNNVNCISVPKTVTELKIDNYIGHWFQVYGAPTNVIFQGNGTCITADYGFMENGDVSVLNSQINSNDELEQIKGYGYYKNVSDPGKLTVHLEGVPVDSPYWVVKLGEIAYNQYQYSIITTPSGVSLWVLVRDIEEFYQLYDKEVRDFLNVNGFKYTTIKQKDCV
jgi:lipocalin